MGSNVIVILSPSFDDLSGVFERLEFVNVETFIPQAPVGGLANAVICGLAGAREAQIDRVFPCPVVKRFGREFGAVIYGDDARKFGLTLQPGKGSFEVTVLSG